MGELVAVAIDAAVGALVRRDIVAAAAVVANDPAINAAQSDLTALVIHTIATQAPVAGDLQFLLSLSHVTYELERIGDHAAGVAKQVIKVGDFRRLEASTWIRWANWPAPSSTVCSGHSWIWTWTPRGGPPPGRRDRPSLPLLLRAALERMRFEPAWVDVGAHLLFAAKNLERIGDRVTNIAEEVVFLATGEVEDLNA